MVTLKLLWLLAAAVALSEAKKKNKECAEPVAPEPVCRNEGIVSCMCPEGYAGRFCEIYDCEGGCEPGYYDDTEGSGCMDVDECDAQENGGCVYGECTNTDGGRECDCEDDWYGPDCFATMPADTAEVEVDGVGVVRGRREEGVDSFLGIPYAHPPLAGYRFMPPSPAMPAEEPIDAFQFRAACWQKPSEHPGIMDPFATDMPVQSEDCLYLNIWRKVPEESGGSGSGEEGPAVLVYVTGGASQVSGGSVWWNAPGMLANDYDVIIVTLNYRVNVFGFFSTAGMDGCPPVMNAGLHDIAAALAWVHDNIGAFGGNADQITVMAEGDAAAGVGILSMIPGPAETFAQVIRVDGGLFNAHTIRPAVLQHLAAGQFAEHLGCGDDDCPLCCMQGIPAHELIEHANHFGWFVLDLGLDEFFPVVPWPFGIDGNDTWFEPGIHELFLTAAGKPTIFGHELSPSFRFTRWMDLPETNLTAFQQLNMEYLRIAIHLATPYVGENWEGFANAAQVADVLVAYYTADRGIADDHQAAIHALNMLMDDFLFYWPTLYEFNGQDGWARRRKDQFCFVHTYTSEHHFPDDLVGDPVSTYAHSMRDFFGVNFFHDFEETAEDVEFREKMRAYFFQFIKHGNPGAKPKVKPVWAKVSGNSGKCMNLNLPGEGLGIINKFRDDARVIWLEIITHITELTEAQAESQIDGIINQIENMVARE